MPTNGEQVKGRPMRLWMIAILGPVIAAIYLPMLSAPFDFIDDGCLVYPHGCSTLGQLVAHTWHTTMADFQNRGPFRPVLWAHLCLQAEVLGGNPSAWRGIHFLWTTLAAASLLLLLNELHIVPVAAIVAAALAMWNPYRGEAWTNLTVTEAVAMPYAILALVAASRAAKSEHSILWDFIGAICMLAALGCKNTFAAVVPAQCALRIVATPLPLCAALRRAWRPAAMLSITLILPIAHFAAYKTTWHPGQYQTSGNVFAQFVEMLHCVRGAMSLEYVVVGFLLAIIAVVHSKQTRAKTELVSVHNHQSLLGQQTRSALVTGTCLLAAGIAIYLPIDGVAGRYSMPAVWGADILIGVLLTHLVIAQQSRWRRAAFIALACGLLGVAIANIGKQDKFIARARLLWDMLEYVEQNVPADACVAWHLGNDLTISEAVHFNNHLQARKRTNVKLAVAGSYDRRLVHGLKEAPPGDSQFSIGGRQMLASEEWRSVRDFHTFFWVKLREFRCRVYERAGDRLLGHDPERSNDAARSIVRQ